MLKGFLRLFFSVALFLAGRAGPAWAQEDTIWIRPFTSGINDFSLRPEEEKISITSQTPLLLRDSPGTVTVIQEEDIAASGARDLMDVLRLIPGFEFSADVQGVIGIGVRGNSANEATVILIDGMEMNELLFGSNQFGNHFPVDLIRKIEVIRGPGSVMYGGFAVFAVINILTHNSDWHNGIRVAQTLGETASGMARRNTTAVLGHQGKGYRLSVSGNLSDGIRSDRDYTDLKGNSYNMRRYSAISSKFLGVYFNSGNLYFRSVLDRYNMDVRDFQTVISGRSYPVDFNSMQADLRYQLKKSENFILTPFLNYRNQLPWSTPNQVDSADLDVVVPYRVRARRLFTGASFIWNYSSTMETTGGLQAYREWADDTYKTGGKDESAAYQCLTGYLQTIWKTRYGQFTGGARLDYHSFYQPTFSGRLSYNRSWKNLYLKGSLNRSFRTPAMANITNAIDEQIRPQITNSAEIEAGFENGNGLQWSLNLYRILNREGIVFLVLEDGLTEGYSNSGRMGTQGLESSFRYVKKKVDLSLSYSLYTTRGMPVFPGYAVDNRPLNLAYPGQKFTAQCRFRTTDKQSFSATLIGLSAAYGFNGNFDAPAYTRYEPVAQMNVFYSFRDVFIKGLQVGVGVFDLTNSRYRFIQSYDSGHMPIPAMSREWVIKISYGIQTANTN